jgi:methionyl-tRNA formyltransferase
MNTLVFFGTGEFAADVLRSINADTDWEILAVITSPDRPAGRGQTNTPSAVKQTAEKNGLPIFQPEKLAGFDIAELARADIGVVAEYGYLLPAKILKLPKHGTVNLHGSLLPKYRGASPIQTAMLNGEKITGVTLMLMDAKMDHGPIISQAETKIDPDEMKNELYAKLSKLAAEIFLRDTPRYISGELVPTEQDHANATYCKILSRDDGRLNFHSTSLEAYNQYRALTPWPGIWSLINSKRLKFHRLTISDRTNLTPGQIQFDGENIFVGCAGNTSFKALELQLEGRSAMTASEFINGNKSANGQILS